MRSACVNILWIQSSTISSLCIIPTIELSATGQLPGWRSPYPGSACNLPHCAAQPNNWPPVTIGGLECYRLLSATKNHGRLKPSPTQVAMNPSCSVNIGRQIVCPTAGNWPRSLAICDQAHTCVATRDDRVVPRRTVRVDRTCVVSLNRGHGSSPRKPLRTRGTLCTWSPLWPRSPSRTCLTIWPLGASRTCWTGCTRATAPTCRISLYLSIGSLNI
jgi:hypothetical protein